MRQLTLVLLLVLFAGIGLSSSLRVQAQDPSASAGPSLLFVQTADGARIDGDTLTLTGVSPAVVFFSDRPERIAGHVRLDGFLQAWGETTDSFAQDPPNANLSVLGEGRITNVQLVLRNPRRKGNELQYTFEVIGGELPEHSGEASLFIDGLFDGSLLGSGAKGAALGAIGGAIAGNAGEGAAIGAAVCVGGNLINQATQD